jgi:AraC-like DNA-binding protein
MINLGPSHTLLTSEGPSEWDSSWFSGLHARAIRIESLSGTHLVSARLHPLGALRLLGPLVPRSVNAVVDLAAVVGDPGAVALRHRLQCSQTPEERFAELEDFLQSRHQLHPAPSPSVLTATRLIEEAHGNLRITTLHLSLGLSRKQLWLRFAHEVGMSPKAYAGLQRFIWTLARLRESTEVDWPRLALDAGYSDQSHLVRDFRRVSAASPTEFLRTRSPDSTALLDAPG